MPSRSQRCRSGTSPERSARRSTPWATPSSWTNTTPGHVGDGGALGPPAGLAGDARWSSHASSSMREHATTIAVVTTTRPIDDRTARSRSRRSRRRAAGRARSRRTAALSTIAPSPSVSTESGTTRNASAGQTTALATPTTNPASSASQTESIEKPGQDRGQQPQRDGVNAVTSRLRHSDRPATTGGPWVRHGRRRRAGTSSHAMTRPRAAAGGVVRGWHPAAPVRSSVAVRPAAADGPAPSCGSRGVGHHAVRVIRRPSPNGVTGAPVVEQLGVRPDGSRQRCSPERRPGRHPGRGPTAWPWRRAAVPRG